MAQGRPDDVVSSVKGQQEAPPPPPSQDPIVFFPAPHPSVLLPPTTTGSQPPEPTAHASTWVSHTIDSRESSHQARGKKSTAGEELVDPDLANALRGQPLPRTIQGGAAQEQRQVQSAALPDGLTSLPECRPSPDEGNQKALLHETRMAVQAAVAGEELALEVLDAVYSRLLAQVEAGDKLRREMGVH